MDVVYKGMSQTQHNTSLLGPFRPKTNSAGMNLSCKGTVVSEVYLNQSDSQHKTYGKYDFLQWFGLCYQYDCFAYSD